MLSLHGGVAAGWVRVVRSTSTTLLEEDELLTLRLDVHVDEPPHQHGARGRDRRGLDVETSSSLSRILPPPRRDARFAELSFDALAAFSLPSVVGDGKHVRREVRTLNPSDRERLLHRGARGLPHDLARGRRGRVPLVVPQWPPCRGSETTATTTTSLPQSAAFNRSRRAVAVHRSACLRRVCTGTSGSTTSTAELVLLRLRSIYGEAGSASAMAPTRLWSSPWCAGGRCDELVEPEQQERADVDAKSAPLTASSRSCHRRKRRDDLRGQPLRRHAEHALMTPLRCGRLRALHGERDERPAHVGPVRREPHPREPARPGGGYWRCADDLAEEQRATKRDRRTRCSPSGRQHRRGGAHHRQLALPVPRLPDELHGRRRHVRDVPLQRRPCFMPVDTLDDDAVYDYRRVTALADARGLLARPLHDEEPLDGRARVQAHHEAPWTACSGAAVPAAAAQSGNFGVFATRRGPRTTRSSGRCIPSSTR